MAALDNLNTNLTAQTTAIQDLTAAVSKLPVGGGGAGGATETQVQTAADQVAANTAAVQAQTAAVQAASQPPAPAS